MFHISIKFDATGSHEKTRWLYGLNAVDFCRHHGLKLSSIVIVKDDASRRIDVDEAFVRAFFENHGSVEDSEDVYADMLMSGELKIEGQTVGLAELSNERIIQLYHGGARRRLLEVIAELEKKVPATPSGE